MTVKQKRNLILTLTICYQKLFALLSSRIVLIVSLSSALIARKSLFQMVLSQKILLILIVVLNMQISRKNMGCLCHIFWIFLVVVNIKKICLCSPTRMLTASVNYMLTLNKPLKMFVSACNQKIVCRLYRKSCLKIILILIYQRLQLIRHFVVWVWVVQDAMK